MTVNWQYPQISRRAFLAGLMAYSAFPGIGLSAPAEKSDLPVVVRRPYLQRCHATGIVIMWYTDIPAETHVRFGTEWGVLDQSFTMGGERRRHVARINGLQPETKYYYSVGTQSDVLDGDNPETYFITAPPSGKAKPTRIWVLGDSGHANAASRSMRDSYYAYSSFQHTDLCLMLGDNAYRDGTDSEYQAAVFDMFHEQLVHTPLWPAYGNHDARCEDCVSAEQIGPFFNIFKTPMLGEAGGASSGRRDFYSFDYGDIHFVCLNSHDGSESHMLHWLEGDLRRSNASWLIAFWHHPPYSKSFHDSDTSIQLQYMRTHVVPILEKHGVDLVLSGHNHSYERSFYINGHYATSGTFDESMVVMAGNGNPDMDGAYVKQVGPYPGTVYVAAGCASEVKDGPLNHPVMAVSENMIGSVVIDIDDLIMDVRFLDLDGVSQDSFQIQKTRGIYMPIALS